MEQASSISQMTTASSITKGNHVEDGSSTPQLKHTITTTPVSSENEYFTIVPTNSGGTTLSSSQSISFATAEIRKQTASTLNTSWKNNSKSEVSHATKGMNTRQTDASTIPSLHVSQKAAMFEHSTSLSIPHQSTSEDTSIGISTRLLRSTTTPESEETAASHRGHSVVTSNMVTSQDTSTTASNTETQHSVTQASLLSESVGHSINSPSPSWTHSTWEGSMFASSTRPTPDTPSHSPVPADAERYSTSSPISVTSIFTVAKDPIPSRLFTTSGSVTHSTPSSNSAQLSTISQKTSVSSLTPENSMEDGTYTPHAKHTITSISASPEKKSFTTIMPIMEHTRPSPSQPVSSESTETETGTASSLRTAGADFSTPEDINSTTEYSPSQSGLPMSPSLFESRTGAMSNDSTSLLTPHQSTSEDTSTVISTSLPTSAISTESEEMTSRPMGHSLVMTDIFTYPDISSTTSVKDTHSSGMHTYPHSESTAPFNTPASASWTLTSGEGSRSTDSTATAGLLSVTSGASLPDRHRSHSPDSVTSVFTVTKDLFSTDSHTSSDPVTTYIPSWSTISQHNSNTVHTSQTSKMNKFSSVTPGSNMKASSSVPQLKDTITPTSVSSENKAFPTTLPITQISTLSHTQPTSFELEKTGTETFSPLTTLTQATIPEKLHLSTDTISSHSEVPYSSPLPAFRTVSMSPDNTIFPMLQQFTSEDTKFTAEDMSSGVVTKLYGSNITESEEIRTSQIGDSEVTSNMALSPETSPVSSVSHNLTSFTPVPLVTETATFVSQSYGVPSITTFPTLKGSQPANSLGYLDGSTLTSPGTSTVEHSTPSPSSVVSAFTSSREVITTGLDIHDLSTSLPNWSSSTHSSQETSQVTKFSQTSSASSLKAETIMETSSSIPQSKFSISESTTAGKVSTKSPLYFSASEDITTGSIPSRITYPSTKEHIELTSVFESGNSGSLLYDTPSRDTATPVSMAEFSSPEPQTSPHLALKSQSSSSEEQSHVSSLPKEKHTSSDSTSTMIEKTTPSPVISTSQVQNVSSLNFVTVLVTSVQETISNGKDKSVASGSTSIQGLDTTEIPTLGPSNNIRNLKTSHSFSKNPTTTVKTNSPEVHSQATVLVNSIPSRITTAIMKSQNNWDTTLSTSMPISKPAHTKTQEDFPLTSVKQKITMPEDTNLMTKSSSDLFTVLTRTSTGFSRTEANSTERQSISGSGSFTETTDISMGSTSSISTLSFPDIGISQVINAAESSKITTLWNTSGTTANIGALSSATQTFLHPDSMPRLSSSESLSWTGTPSHEATPSVNSAEIPGTTSFPATSTSEGQSLSSPASMAPIFSFGQTTTKELDTNLASFTTLFPSWRNSELATSEDTRTSQTSHSFTRTEVSSVDITTPGPQFQNTVSFDAASPDGTASSLLTLPTKTLPSSAFSLSSPSSNPTSFPETSFPTFESFKTTDTLSRSLETGTSSPPNLSTTSHEILGLSDVTTDTENFHTSSKFKVTNTKTISMGHELSSSIPTPPESFRDTYTMGTSSSIWVTSMSTPLPAYLETTRSDTEQFSHSTSGLRDTSMSLQAKIPSAPVSTLILPVSESAVITPAMTMSTPHQTPSSQFTEALVETVTTLNPSSSIVESTGVTSSPESNFTMPSSESTHVPGTDMLPSDETTFIETTTLSPTEEMASLATTSIAKGSSAVTSSSPLSITKSSHGDVLISTIVEKLPSSASTPLPFPASTGTDFTSSPALHRITPTETENSAQSHTEIPDGAAHGDTAGLGNGPLASTSPASPKELTTKGTVKVETTATSLKATSIATSTTKIPTTTSRPLSHLKTPEKIGNINTTEMIITASDTSHDVLGTAASFPTGSGENTSMVLRTRPSSYSKEPESTALLIPSLRTETSPDVHTLNISSGESDTVSWVTHPLEITSPVAKITMNISQGESDSIVSTATTPRGEVTSTFPTLTALSTIPDLATSLISRPEENTSMFISTLTDSLSKPKTTASGVTHPGMEVDYSIASTFSTDTSGMATSLDINSGADTKPALQSLTAAPGESDTTASVVMHLSQSRIPVSENILDISNGETATTTLSMDTTHGTEVIPIIPTTTTSPTITGLRTSLVISSQTRQKNTSASTMTPAGEPESTDTLATDLEAWETTAILNTTTLTAISGKVMESTTSPLIAFPDQLFNTTSWITRTGTEVTSTISTVNISSGEPNTTVSGITHATETSFTVPKTALTFSHGGSYLTLSTATSTGEEASSALPTTVTAPGVPNTMTSLLTSSRAVTSTSTPSLTVPFSKPETTATFATHAGSQISSAITIPANSPTLPGMLTSLITSSGTKRSLSPTLTVSTGQSETTIPWTIHLEAKSSSAVPTSAVFPGEPDTTISLVTPDEAISPTVLKTAPGFSHHGLNVTPSVASSLGTETNLAGSSSVFSPEVSEVLTSLTTSFSTVTSESTPSPSISDDESDTTVSLVSHQRPQMNLTIAILTVSPNVPEMMSHATSSEIKTNLFPTQVSFPSQPETTASEVSHPGDETSSEVPTGTGTLSEPHETGSFVNYHSKDIPTLPNIRPSFSHMDSATSPPVSTTIIGPEASSAVLTTTILPVAPDMVTSHVPSSGTDLRTAKSIPILHSSEPRTIVSLATNAGEEASSAISTSGVSTLGVTEVKTSLVSNSGAETHATTPIPALSPSEPDTIASWVTDSGREGTSDILTLSTLPDGTDETESWGPHSSENNLTVLPITPDVSNTVSGSLPSMATSSETENKSDFSTSTLSPTVSEVLTSLVPTFRTVTSTTIPTLTLSSDKPETGVSMITRTGLQKTSSFPTTTASSDLLGIMTSLVPSSEIYTSTISPTISSYSQELEKTTSQVTLSAISEDSSVTTLTAIPGESGTSASFVPNPEEISSSVPRTSTSFPHVEFHTTPPTTTTNEQEARSSAPTIDISSSIPDSITSEGHTSGEGTRTSKPILTPQPSEPHTKISLISHSGGKTSSPMSTVAVSPGVSTSETGIHTRNWTISPGQPKTTTSWTMNPGIEVNSRVLTTTISPSVLDMVTSKSVNQMPKLQTTISLLTDAGEELSSAMSTLTVSPGITEVTTSLLNNLSTENHVTTSTLTSSPRLRETTTSWINNPEKEAAISGIQTTNSISSVTDMMTSTILNHTPAKPQKTASLDTHAGRQHSSAMNSMAVSQGITEVISWVKSLGTESHRMTSNTALFPIQPEVITPGVTHPGREGTSGVLSTTIEPSVPEMMTSPTLIPPDPYTKVTLVTNIVEQSSSAMSTRPDLPHTTDMIPLLVTTSGTESHSVISTLAVSQDQPETTVQWVTHPGKEDTSGVLSTMTLPPVPGKMTSTILSQTPSEAQTITSLVTHPGGHLNSSMSTQAVSSGVTEMMTSQATTSGTEAHGTSPALIVSLGQTESTASWTTHAEREDTSGILPKSISTGVPDLVTSTTPIPSESHSTVSFVTHIGEQPNSAMSAEAVSSGVTGMIPSLATSSGTKNYSTATTLAVSTDQPGTTAPWVTQPRKEGTSEDLSTTVPDTTAQLVTHPEREATSQVPPTTILTGVPEMMSTTTLISAEQQSAVSLVTHIEGQSSSTMSTSHVSPDITEMIPSTVTSSSTESHSMTPNLVVSPDQRGSTVPWVINPGKEHFSGNLSATVSPSIPDMTSTTVIHTPSKPQTITLLTHSGGYPSSSLSTQAVSSGVREMPPSLVTSLGTGSYVITSTLDVSKDQPETTAPLITHPEEDATSGVPPTTISTSVPEMMSTTTLIPSEPYNTMSFITHNEEQPSSILSTSPVSVGITDVIPSLGISLSTETHSMTSTLGASTDQLGTTAPLDMYPGKEGSSGHLSITNSSSIPGMMTSTILAQTPSEAQTITSLVNHANGHLSSSMSTQAFSSGVTEIMTSPATTPWTETHETSPALLVSSGQTETTASRVTSAKWKDTSGVLTTTIPPNVPDLVISTTLIPTEPHSIVSFVTHIGEQPNSAMSTLAASPGITEMITSLATSSGTKTNSTATTLAVSTGQTGTTGSWVTHSEKADTSDVITTTLSPSAPENITSTILTHTPSKTQTTISVVTHAEAQPSLSMTTPAVSSGVTEMMTSQATTSGTEAHGTSPALVVSPDQTETTASWTTHAVREDTSGVLPNSISTGVPDLVTSTIPTPSESHSTVSFVTHIVITEMIRSVVPSSDTKNSSTATTLKVSTDQPGITTPLVTHPGKEDTLEILSTTPSPSVPDMMTSTTLIYAPSEPQTITSLVTHPGGHFSSSMSTQAVSSGVTEMPPSLVTSLGTENYVMTTTLAVSKDHPEITAPLITHPEEDATSGHNPPETQTTISVVTHAEAQPSLFISTEALSSGITEMIPSVVPSSDTKNYLTATTLEVSTDQPGTTVPLVTHPGKEDTLEILSTTLSPSVPDMMTSTTMIHAPSEPQTITSLVTHPGGHFSSSMSTQAVSSGIAEMPPSLVTSLGTESYAMSTTLVVSPGQTETTSQWLTHPGREGTSEVLFTTILPTVPEMKTSPTLIPSEPHTTVSLVTNTGEQPSSAMSTRPVSSGITERIPSLVTSSGTDIHPMTSTLAVSPGQTESTAPWVTHPEKEDTSGVLTSTISPSVPDMMASTSLNHITSEPQTITLVTHTWGHTSLSMSTQAVSPHVTEMIPSLVTSTGMPEMTSPNHISSEAHATISFVTHVEGQPSSALSTRPVSPHITEIIPSLVTSSHLERDSVSSTPTASSGQPETTASWVTHSVTEATLNILRTSASPSVTDMMSSPTLFSSEPHTMISLVSHVDEQPSSAMSTSPVSPGITEMMTSPVTTSETETHTTTPTLTVSSSQTRTTASWVTHPGKEATSISTLSASPGEPKRTETWLITSAKPSTPLSTTPPTFSYSGSNITSSASGAETTPSTTFSSGASEGTTSLPVLSGTETSTAILTVTPALAGTTGLGASISSAESTLTVSPSVPGLPSAPTTSKPGNATSQSLETSASVTTVRLPNFVSDVMTVTPSESSASPLTDLETTSETSHLAITSSRPTGSKTTTTLHASSYAPLTTSKMSTWSSENVTSGPGTTPSLGHFTLNFTITNLRHREGMGSQGSEIFNSTERILNRLLKPMFENTSIGHLYSGCRLILLRPEKDGTATGVDAVCTHHSDPTGLTLDREKLYWEFSHNTHGVTKLGSFALEKDSLYINDFTHRTSASTPNTPVTSSLFFTGTSTEHPNLSTVATPVIDQFTLNFTITNLEFKEYMLYHGSRKFNTLERVLQHLLKLLFKTSSLGPLYSGCALVALGSKKDGTATKVDAICTYHPDPKGHRLNREQLYWELSRLTHSVTRLDPYTLDRDSLYVNGFTHQSSALITTVTHSLVPFTLNFTITNLHYTPVMKHPGSLKFNKTEIVLQHLLAAVFKNTTIGPLYSGCQLTLLTPEKDGSATGVNMICTHQSEPTGMGLDPKQLYWELSRETHGITQLDFMTLDKSSLYVNGEWVSSCKLPSPGSSLATFTEETAAQCVFLPLPTVVPISPLVPFTINFTITNLKYEDSMRHPGSWKFNSTERILQRLLWSLFNKTSISVLYSGCRLISLRPEKDKAATGVDAICTHHPDPTGSELDNEQVYWELSELTNDISELGPYILDHNSLYINGYTHQILSTTSMTAGPVLVHFTINFTIINLAFEEDMSHPGSRKFNITERTLQSLLRPLFQKSSVGSLYSSCVLTSLRSENDGAGTGVDAVCTYHSDPTGPGLNRKTMYWELSRLTYGVSRLGPYTLDKNSLYVDGYTHQILSTTTRTSMMTTASMEMTANSPSPTVVSPLPVPFTINFTVINLEYVEDMGHPGSRKFNATERILQRLLRALIGKTRVGPLYTGCRLTLLRPENKGTATGVDAICTYHPNTSNQQLNREHLYWELKRLNDGIMQLGPYTLDQNSLYVNGYTQHILATTHRTSVMATVSEEMPNISSTPTAAGPVQLLFSINFTIINLEFEEDMSHPGSRKFNITERTLQSLLRPLFKKISVGPLYSGCRLTLLRSENNGAATGVDAACTYHLDSAGHRLENEQIYRELSSLTKGVTELGPYILDQHSLYVNGYTHQILTTTPRTSSSALLLYTLNFTITNLPYTKDMWGPGYAKFNKMEKILQLLLRPLFQNTSIGLLYSGCRLTSLRPKKNGEATKVDMVCAYHQYSTGTDLNREQLYSELKELTHSITQLGHYILDQNSLYVNGYTHQIVVTSTSTMQSPLVLFTLNFTITNLFYEEDMQPPDSKKFNTTERILQSLLESLFRNTSIGPLYAGCRLTLLSPRKDGEATGVDTVCTYHPDHIGQGLAREQLYLELSKLTHGVTQLGPYTLDQDSLYVNGYTHPASDTILNNNGTVMVPITLNFTITNLHYTEEMGNPGSLKFNSTKRVLHYWLETLLNKTSIAPHYSGCRLSSLRSDNYGAATGVDIICTFHSDTMRPGLDRDQLFWELSHETHGITRLGPYTLDQNSLYISGYHFGAAAPATTTGEVSEEMFTVNFTINNLRYSADMGQVGSPKFNITDTLMQHLLRPLFQRSSLGPLYTGCRVATLRSVKNGAQTQVDVLCTYHRVPTGLGLPAKSVFYDLSWQTRGIARLGPYSLDKDTLYINGYNEPGPDVPPTTPEPATTILPSPSTSLQPESNTAMWHHLETFTINFTISNLPYSADMISGSAMFNSTENVLQHLLGPLFQNSSFNSSCRLTSLSPEKNGTFTSVVTTCTYQHDPARPGMDTQGLYSELSHLSHGVTQLGNYTLEKHSLYVNGYNELGPDILTTTPEPSTTIPSFTLTSVQPESTTAVEHHLKTFTINFTISNLPYSEDMSYSSAVFNSTESVLQHLLRPLFQNIFFNSSCRLTSLRPEKNQNSTSVNVICSYQHDSAHPGLHTQEIYSELSHLTHGVTQLGNYTLDENSLYVNGYSGTGTEESTMNPELTTTILPSPSISVQTESTTAVGHHMKTVTVSFIISNLPYSASMNNGSALFNSTETLLKNLLEPLLHNVFFNSSCRLDSLRAEKNGTATGVDAICTYHHDPSLPGMDTQGLYSKLSNMTHGITHLSNYTLDKESLYVNGYNKPAPEEHPITPETSTTILPSTSTSLQPEPYTAMGHHLEILTINFTITNLPYSSNMSNGSAVFSSTESVLQYLLGHLFQNGSFNSTCRLDSLRPKKNGTATGVDAICTYHHDPSHPGMDIQGLYSELKNLTQGITQLGNYSLDKDSLYVNGYNEHGAEGLPTTPGSPTTILASPSKSVQPEPTTAMGHLKTFTLNFTISNLPYSAGMSSAMFNSTERILQHLLGPLVQNESLYSDCRLVSLRPKKNGTATGVNAICSYHHNPAYPELDTQGLYTKLSQLTHGITQLGSYMLDQNSLYVNGYTHQITRTTPSGYVLQNVTIKGKYQINFHIINWDLSNTDPTSSEYVTLERDIEDKVTTLYTGSQLQEVFQSCLVTNLTSGSMMVTIEALFSSYLDPNLVKQVFLNKTLNASSHWLGATYQLTDLHVIDMKPPILLPTEVPTTSSSSQHFNLNFTITNLPYSQDIAQPGTSKHEQNKRSIEYALNQLFRNSSIKSYFSDCQVLAFRSVSNSNHTGVDSLCNFSPLARRVDRVAIYEEFLRMTQNGTQLLNFTLDRKSVLVDGYSSNREDDVIKNSGLPFWAIILICLAVLLVLITCLMCCFLVTVCRRKKEGDYQVQRHRLGYYLPHLDLRKFP
nr:mucin-16 [Peromyscus maniculatus bairdii]